MVPTRRRALRLVSSAPCLHLEGAGPPGGAVSGEASAGRAEKKPLARLGASASRFLWANATSLGASSSRKRGDSTPQAFSKGSLGGSKGIILTAANCEEMGLQIKEGK